MQLLPHKVVFASMFSDLYSEGPASPCFLIRDRMALLVSFPPLSSPCGRNQTKRAKVPGTTCLWVRTYARYLLQPELPLCFVLPKSASCLLDRLPMCLAFLALADFPGVALLNTQTSRVGSSIILTLKPVKDITKQNKRKEKKTKQKTL